MSTDDYHDSGVEVELSPESAESCDEAVAALVVDSDEMVRGTKFWNNENRCVFVNALGKYFPESAPRGHGKLMWQAVVADFVNASGRSLSVNSLRTKLKVMKAEFAEYENLTKKSGSVIQKDDALELLRSYLQLNAERKKMSDAEKAKELEKSRQAELIREGALKRYRDKSDLPAPASEEPPPKRERPAEPSPPPTKDAEQQQQEEPAKPPGEGAKPHGQTKPPRRTPQDPLISTIMGQTFRDKMERMALKKSLEEARIAANKEQLEMELRERALERAEARRQREEDRRERERQHQELRAQFEAERAEMRELVKILIGKQQ